ncbi:DEAD/DEAH box helicase [Rossellomorea marisflavi]|uniref:DEAD/DEAH box helicase n=1 Tax=Rossellomorea marisflavi TaxID=189381 RepID=UPI0039BFA76A
MSSIKWKNRSLLSSRLRMYQIDAIETSLKYIKSDSTDQALIKMPTGTGKTFVIGVLSCFISGCNNVLVVSPSSAIRDHLYDELNGELWEKMNIDVDHGKSVYELYPNNVCKLLEERAGKKVYISTIQGLTKMKAEKPELFYSLKDTIDLILFDEGHKEPANTWSDTIRSIGTKTVLFTATPIRNDYQIFTIDETYYYNYSIKEAIDEEMIRVPYFKFINQGTFASTKEKIQNFINQITTLRQNFIDENNYEPKVIIRFQTFYDLNIGIEYLIEKEEDAVGIHDQFKDTKGDKYRFKTVPRNNDAIYWLAQDKLVEGIDDSKFAILAIYGSFNNTRSLIQQIGRVLRIDNNAIHLKNSWVVVRTEDSFQEVEWNSYIDFETNNAEENKLPIINFKNHFNDFLSNQPDYIYGSNRFLKKIDLNTEYDFDESKLNYKMPLRVNIFSLKEGTTFEYAVLINKIVKQKEYSNEFVLREHKDPNEDKGIYIYSKYRNSSILSIESFVEVQLGAFFLWTDESFLFFYDTNNYIPNCILEIADPVSNSKLQYLFNDSTEFTEVTLKNGLISQNNIHRRVMNARNMKNIAPDFTDKYNFCTTITGTVEEDNSKNRRYIGFSNSRVSDSSSYVLLIEYLDWIKKIADKVKIEDGKINDFFTRYAPVVDTPERTQPILITFNLGEFDGSIVDSNQNKVCVKVENYKVEDNKFVLKIGQEEIQTKIFFSEKKYKLAFENNANTNKYKITFFENEEFTIRDETLISFFNRFQYFHIVTIDGAHIYHRNEFFKCEIPTEATFLDPIFNEYQLKEDKKIKSEKGTLTEVRQEWTEDSLFYLVSSLGAELEDSELKKALTDMKYLICTDLNTEIADFVGLDTDNKRIYFIHCKAKKAKYSASVFQDICSQIIKNLDYVHPQSNRVPDDLETWNNDWKREKVTRNRVIKGAGNTTDIWNLIKEYKRLPDSTTYVWGLTAKMFSLQEYKRQKNLGVSQAPEIIQIDYILMNTWAAVQSVGARFKFFFDKKA